MTDFSLGAVGALPRGPGASILQGVQKSEKNQNAKFSFFFLTRYLHSIRANVNTRASLFRKKNYKNYCKRNIFLFLSHVGRSTRLRPISGRKGSCFEFLEGWKEKAAPDMRDPAMTKSITDEGLSPSSSSPSPPRAVESGERA